jgi:hypothetical protein
LDKEVSKKRVIVLKPQVSKDEVEEIVEKKKNSLFGTVFTRPKQEEINVNSIELFYEPCWIVGGEYKGDYYRKNVYEVKTEPIVKEVKIGDGVFPVEKKSSGWAKIKRGVAGGNKDNKLAIPVEEHVEIDIEDEIIFNSQGNETKLNYKIESKHQENFPDKILKEKQENVRDCLVNQEEVLKRLENMLKEDIEEDVKMVKEKISIDKLEEVFVPVYEARCVDKKNKVKIIRIDAINKKILG